jgi:hypothetical protein
LFALSSVNQIMSMTASGWSSVCARVPSLGAAVNGDLLLRPRAVRWYGLTAAG